MNIGIVDYNMGNLASVKNALEALGAKASVESDPNKLKNYDKLILPGVGAFGDAMEHLKDRSMDDALKSYAKSGKWMIGICLGLQLLFDSSEEFGEHRGLGLIEGSVKAFEVEHFSENLKVPHMGWNRIFFKANSPIFKGFDSSAYLYFVHSLHVQTEQKYVIGESEYGYNFTSAVQKDNIFGIQPHPEKSHDNGLKILKNFINLG